MSDTTSPDWLSFVLDMNSDGRFTAMDAWLWVVQLFFLPGNSVLWLLLEFIPSFASFLELGSTSYYGALAAGVSAAFWFFAIVLIGVVIGAIRNFDRALTAVFVRIYNELVRTGRVFKRLSFFQARRLRAAISLRRQQASVDVDIDELDLDDLELEVLRSHALLAPGFVMGVTELAGSLEIRRRQAQQLVAKLEKLKLLQRAFSESDGGAGYRLSQPGRFVLMAKTRIAAADSS
jgi:DNA-binding MarR family transcriptional regulator